MLFWKDNFCGRIIGLVFWKMFLCFDRLNLPDFVQIDSEFFSIFSWPFQLCENTTLCPTCQLFHPLWFVFLSFPKSWQLKNINTFQNNPVKMIISNRISNFIWLILKTWGWEIKFWKPQSPQAPGPRGAVVGDLNYHGVSKTLCVGVPFQITLHEQNKPTYAYFLFDTNFLYYTAFSFFRLT